MCCALLATPSAADAHSAAVATDPRNGAVLKAAPQIFTFTFHDPSRFLKLIIEKIGAPAVRDVTPLPKEPGRQFQIKAPSLDAGQYVLRYRAMGPDGHIVPGTVKFTIAGSAKAAEVQPSR